MVEPHAGQSATASGRSRKIFPQAGQSRRSYGCSSADSACVGGEGTMGAAAHMSAEGVPVVGIPKTIDNDLSGTDACIGFATAVQVSIVVVLMRLPGERTLAMIGLGRSTDDAFEGVVRDLAESVAVG